MTAGTEKNQKARNENEKTIAVALLSGSFVGVSVGYGQTQSEMNRAAIVDLKSAKDELTRVYQKVISALLKGIRGRPCIS